MRLSPRDLAVIETVNRFHQATSLQLRRLHFAEGSEASRGVKQRRTMARLVKWGKVQRLPRPIGGGLGGSEGYCYVPASSRTRLPDPHTLDITELYVRLMEASGELLVEQYEPEPLSYLNVGHVELKPDAFLRVKTSRGTYSAFIEVDRSTEYGPQLKNKMRRYALAYEKWQGSTFPQVCFVVPDARRIAFVDKSLKRYTTPQLHRVMLLNTFVEELVK